MGLDPALEWIDLDERDVLSLDGNRGDALYFIASGRLEIVNASGERDSAADDDPQVLAVIIAGDVISEMRTLTGSSDVAAARCVTAARIVRLAKEGFDRYLITNPDVGAKLENIFAPRFYYNDMVRVLRNMFGDLTEEVQADIEQRLTWRHVPRETALFRQGKLSGSLFVVISDAFANCSAATRVKKGSSLKSRKARPLVKWESSLMRFRQRRLWQFEIRSFLSFRETVFMNWPPATQS